MYELAKPLLFLLPEETAHRFAMSMLSAAAAILPDSAARPPEIAKKTLMGLDFPNPIGVAAGLDKDALHIQGLGLLGFGFIEVGTVTPKPQPGNPKPRLFRLKRNRALINRMGFNNNGLEACVGQLSKHRFEGIVGVNIGKNAATSGMADTLADYCLGFETVYPFADYVTLNLSSPNTPGLRDLQTSDFLAALLKAVGEVRLRLQEKHDRHVPIVLKIAPDLDDNSLAQILDSLLAHAVEGVIATNTTTQRPPALDGRHKAEEGGLSGAPVHEMAVAKVERIRAQTGDALTVIGVGGIMDAADAADFYSAGADLVQLYSGLIYSGPGLPKRLLRALC